MEENKKHMKILADVTGISSVILLIKVDEALAAMQVLQDQIDSLVKENSMLKLKSDSWCDLALKKEIKITEHQLRELKNPKNPE